MANFIDERNNFLFVKKQGDKLLDYFFIHLDNSDDLSFMAHYESYNSDKPLSVYKLDRIKLSNEKENPIDFDNEDIAQEWRHLRVGPILRSDWRMFFEDLVNEIKKNNETIHNNI